MIKIILFAAGLALAACSSPSAEVRPVVVCDAVCQAWALPEGVATHEAPLAALEPPAHQGPVIIHVGTSRLIDGRSDLPQYLEPLMESVANAGRRCLVVALQPPCYELGAAPPPSVIEEHNAVLEQAAAVMGCAWLRLDWAQGRCRETYTSTWIPGAELAGEQAARIMEALDEQ